MESHYTFRLLKAGVKVGDIVVAIDGVSMARQPHGAVATAMGGKTTVNITVVRP